MRSAHSKLILSLTIVVLVFDFDGHSLAQTPQVKIGGSLDLMIGGIQATVTPAQPTVSKNVAGRRRRDSEYGQTWLSICPVQNVQKILEKERGRHSQ